MYPYSHLAVENELSGSDGISPFMTAEGDSKTIGTENGPFSSVPVNAYFESS